MTKLIASCALLAAGSLTMSRPFPGASAARIFAGIGPRIALKADDETGTGDLRKLAVDLKTATDEVKTFAERANTEIKNLGKVTEETKANADKALTDMNGISERLTTLEQKMAKRGTGSASGQDEHKSAGYRFIESEEFKAASTEGDRFKGRVNVEVKAITSASVSGAGASTALVAADRVPGVIEIPKRSLRVRDLLLPGRTNSAMIEYVKENVVTLNAAPVAENPSSPKPQSDLTYLLTNTSVRTIAHFIIASKQILADAPQLQSQIDGRLRYGLEYAEEQQLLLGDGTGVNLFGLMPQATVYASPTGVTITGETMIDRLRLAMLQATLALFPATGHVLNPTDWASIELKKDTTGRYIWANPAALVGPTMWGLPVVDSLSMPQNNFLTGAFKYAAQIFDREDANVLLSTEDRDNFVKNMVTILAEERLGLAVYRPQALIKGTFTGAA